MVIPNNCLTRSIPACAGEAQTRGINPAGPGVYPRVCGGSIVQLSQPSSAAGLSPRVRGKPVGWLNDGLRPGSIPACAGEAACGWIGSLAAWVYPRVCGGSVYVLRYSSVADGLSPRVRGKPRSQVKEQLSNGSIPACAGEAPARPALTASKKVYPRVCGGSSNSSRPRPISSGLSPRVRGKP